MKVLFSDTTYSYLSPGGKQVHAKQLYQHLSQLGVDMEYESWHDPQQSGDIVHCFGFNDPQKIRLLKKSGYKLVYTHIVDVLTNKSRMMQFCSRIKYAIIRAVYRFTSYGKLELMFPWLLLSEFDRIVYMHEKDRDTALYLYGVEPSKTSIIPHAVDDLSKYNGKAESPTDSPKYLVSLGSVTQRKNSLFTAQLCAENNIPIKFIGPAADVKSAYFKEFISLTQHSCVEYLGFQSEEAKIEVMKNASGFVLLSRGESGCISVYEAAITGLPLLLSDLPWAKGYENPVNIQFCSVNDRKLAAASLSEFYNQSVRQEAPSFTVHTWLEIAEKYKTIYTTLID